MAHCKGSLLTDGRRCLFSDRSGEFVQVMRYSESRDRSAEILRIALTSMSRQRAGFHPLSYAIWYEHIAGLNPALSKVLDKRIGEGTPLGEIDVWRLHAQYVLARDVVGFEQLQDQLRTLLAHAATRAKDANAEAAQFGTTLRNHQAQLEGPIDEEALASILGTLLTSTQRMESVTADLSEKLEASAKEVEQLVERLAQAQSEAMIDALTGLKNRRGLDRALEAGFHLEGAALLVIDIDHFKAVNDECGHLLGDKVIRAVAHALQSSIKGRDIAVRLGGEEFLVVLPETHLDGAITLAEQIRQSIARGRIRRTDRNEYVGNITVSIGVARARTGEQLDDVLERADSAMYMAKREGRNRVVMEVLTPDALVRSAG